MKTIFLLVCIVFSTTCSAQYPNTENRMLSDSINSFVYFFTKDPIPFSDPRSLADTERRSAACDKYHQESENMLNMGLRYRQQQQQQMQQQGFYQLPYRRPPGLITPYP